MADEERAAKRKRFASRIITLKVGAKSEIATVHEDRLRASSPFFRAALDKKWQEGQSGEIALPEDEIDAVSTYVDWLYSERVTNVQEPADKSAHLLFLAQLYIFGEKCQDDDFCDSVLSTLLKQIDVACKGGRTYPNMPVVKAIYEGTLKSSPARACLVAIMAQYARKGWDLFDDDTQYPHELLLDLSRALLLEKRKEDAAPKHESLHDRRADWFKKK